MKHPSYQKLCTEYYDQHKAWAEEREIAFFEPFLNKGPALEAMCGTGRLLIPLLKKGYSVDGVDKSKHMLERCKERAEKLGLNPILFHQPLETLDITKRYATVFIAVGSFQLFEKRKEALIVLKKLRDHLMPGGQLILDTFIPWELISRCISEGKIQERGEIEETRKVALEDGSEIELTSLASILPKEQLIVSENKYVKIKDFKVIEEEEEHLPIRWYYPNEMQLLLEKAGFSRIQIMEASFDLNPQAIVYTAQRTSYR